MFRVAAIAFLFVSAYAQTSPQQILDQAVAAQRAGQYAEAVRLYRSLVEKFPNIGEIHSNLGAALSGEGRYSEAVVEYQRALELKPEPAVRLNLALAYYKSDDLPMAVETLKTVRQESPQNIQAITVLADCYLRLGRNKDVIDLLTPVYHADPTNRTFEYLLGTALVRDGQADKGQVIIDRILHNGDSAEARLLMGTTKFTVKDFAGALVDFQKAVELNPELPDLYSYYGLALLTTGDQAGAKKAFEQELRRDPNNFDANLRMGVLYRQDQANDEALKFFQHALQIRPGDFGVRYQIACVELALGNLSSAQHDLEALVKEAPEFTEAHVTLATVYFRQKNKVDGNRERAIVLKLNAERQAEEPGAKDSAEAHFAAGKRKFESGDYPGAVQEFAGARGMNPKLPQLQSFYGRALLNTGDPDAAADAFRKELAANPNDAASNLALGEILNVRKQYGDAIPLLRQALQLQPDSAEGQRELASALAGNGQFREARSYAEAGVKLAPRSAEAHQTLAAIYAGLDLKADAARESHTALSLVNASAEGPKIDDPAPDFELPNAASGDKVRLSEFRGKSPVVLVFGSYSCPNFRAAADTLKRLQSSYGARAPFLLVYIREAHAGDNWQSTRNTRDGIAVAPATTSEDKQKHAVMCSRELHLSFPALVDGLDGEVEAAYHAWPSRAFVIDANGRVLYSTHLTELDFHPEEMKAALRKATAQ